MDYLGARPPTPGAGFDLAVAIADDVVEPVQTLDG
jgi:hypothetical protein